ncbi:hypothetical protein [Variovorax sp. PCZ-1]|uniref:hypothetical protein n=1 Tax=Variovorax sp. PCZ-1 TaxID=2835533 RepID=UPI001BCBFD0B|nr:hypothetical protein [Variovorax sp. PCZ-1]MBS7806752.1 hypothetical protein [Variovorax sp. PCZ-1]
MLTKLLRAISGSPERTDWESMLTQVGGESSAWNDSDVMRTGSFGTNRFVAAPDVNAPDVNLALLGLSGEEVYARAKAIAKELHALAERGATVQQWNILIRDVTALADMGQTINSLAEIKLRRVKPQIQSIPMLPLMGSILAKRANDLRRSGVLLVPQLQSCSIDGDPNLCRALIESAIEWAIPFGNRLTVTTELSSWGDAARMAVLADHVVRTQDDTPAMERTSLFLWELITELAQAAGVLVTRSQVDGKTAISIEFPVQNETDNGVVSSEMSMLSKDMPQLAQMDVLVYVSGSPVKMAVDKALSKAECRTRYATSLTHLVRECEMSLPAAMVIESELMDENVQSLIEDLRRHIRSFALIEIVKATNVYEVSLPGSKKPCRLSVASIDAHLRDALLFELAQA